MWKWKPDVEFQYGGRLGEFTGMSSHSHVSHCRVLPLGEFTVTIPEPHATLQGAVTWRNQCRDRATLQGAMIRHIENCFSPYFIFVLFLMQLIRLWRAVAFVSSPIHLLFCWGYNYWRRQLKHRAASLQQQSYLFRHRLSRRSRYCCYGNWQLCS